jgi:ribosomal protein L37AE/L43A
MTVEDKKTCINKVISTMLCPTCKVLMLQRHYYGGGIYWICGKCHCKVESTGC